MSAKNPKAGRGPCPNCGESVLFRQSPTSGRLTYSCDHCDHAAFADPGGKAHAKWTASLTDKPAAIEVPAVVAVVAVPEAVPPIKPDKPHKRAAFSLDAL